MNKNIRRMSDPHFNNGRYYLGASNMPTLSLLNLDYGQSPMTLYEEIKGIGEKFEGNEITQSGHHQEPYILSRFLQEYFELSEVARQLVQIKLIQNEDSPFYKCITEAIHSDYPFIKAHADLLVRCKHCKGEQTDPDCPDCRGEGYFLVQAKNTAIYGLRSKSSKIGKGYDKEDLSVKGVPDSVFLQEQTELFCYDLKVAYVAVLIDGNTYKTYGQINRDHKIQEQILAMAYNFWHNHILTDEPPKPEIWGDVKKYYPDSEKGTAEVLTDASQEVFDLMQKDLVTIDKKKATLDRKREDILKGIGLMIGNCQYLMSKEGDKLASTFIKAGQERISLKALKEKYPKMYDFLKSKDDIITQDKESKQMRIGGKSYGVSPTVKYTLILNGKKERKKYTTSEKKIAEMALKNSGVDYKFEKFTK